MSILLTCARVNLQEGVAGLEASIDKLLAAAERALSKDYCMSMTDVLVGLVASAVSRNDS